MIRVKITKEWEWSGCTTTVEVDVQSNYTLDDVTRAARATLRQLEDGEEAELSTKVSELKVGDTIRMQDGDLARLVRLDALTGL